MKFKLYKEHLKQLSSEIDRLTAEANACFNDAKQCRMPNKPEFTISKPMTTDELKKVSSVLDTDRTVAPISSDEILLLDADSKCDFGRRRALLVGCVNPEQLQALSHINARPLCDEEGQYVGVIYCASSAGGQQERVRCDRIEKEACDKKRYTAYKKGLIGVAQKSELAQWKASSEDTTEIGAFAAFDVLENKLVPCPCDTVIAMTLEDWFSEHPKPNCTGALKIVGNEMSCSERLEIAENIILQKADITIIGDIIRCKVGTKIEANTVDIRGRDFCCPLRANEG